MPSKKKPIKNPTHSSGKKKQSIRKKSSLAKKTLKKSEDMQYRDPLTGRMTTKDQYDAKLKTIKALLAKNTPKKIAKKKKSSRKPKKRDS